MLDLLTSAADFLGGGHVVALASGGLSLASGGFLAKTGAKLAAVACLVLAALIGGVTSATS